MVREFNGKFELVDPKKIQIDRSYQRPERPALIGDIATDFGWPSFGVVTVYKRNSSYFAVDGQQRLAAALTQEPAPKEVPCLVFPKESLQNEAKTFLNIQVNRKAVTPLEKFRAQLVQRDASAVTIQRVLDEVGYAAGIDAENPRVISAVRSLQTIYTKLGEEGLKQVLLVARDAWPDEVKGVSSHMLHLLSDVIEEQRDAGSYNRNKLSAAMRSTTPQALMKKARANVADMTGSLRVNLRRAAKQVAKV
jgi:hypothetical protein